MKLVKKKDNKMNDYMKHNLRNYHLNDDTEYCTVKFFKIKNNINGNPRYVVHFMDYLQLINEYSNYSKKSPEILLEIYNYAVNHSKKYGGKKYHHKDFGGGIVFCTYSLKQLVNWIKEDLK